MRKIVLILALIPLLTLSCSSKTVTKKVDNPGVIYVEGVELMKKKKWDQAIGKFSQVRENYPFDPIADVAAVKLGDVYFERKEYLMASGVYTDFLNSHPDDENAPYVLWRLGESFEKLSLTIDRDQTYTLKAIERLTYLQNRYEDTQYARDATVPLQRMTQKLADREIYVGEYYYKTGNYNASVTRLEYFMTKYPGVKGTDRALFTLSAAYRELADPERARLYYEKLVELYPTSPLLKTKGKKGVVTKVSMADSSSSNNPKRIIVSSPATAGSTGSQNKNVVADAGNKMNQNAGTIEQTNQTKKTPLPDDKPKASASVQPVEEKEPQQTDLRLPAAETKPDGAEKATAESAPQGAGNTTEQAAPPRQIELTPPPAVETKPAGADKQTAESAPQSAGNTTGQAAPPRQIELVPPTATEAKEKEAEKQTTSDPQQPEGATGQAAQQPVKIAPAQQATQGTAQQPADKPADRSTEKQQPNKAEEKSGALGFFTSKKPVDIISDNMEGLEKGKIIIFKGNVITKQDDLQIFSDTLTAHLNEESNEVERADAEGNVKIIKADRTATCNQAIFENAKGEITLKGNVVVYSGSDKLAGETVIYYINEDRVTVEGEKDSRARVTVQPKK